MNLKQFEELTELLIDIDERIDRSKDNVDRIEKSNFIILSNVHDSAQRGQELIYFKDDHVVFNGAKEVILFHYKSQLNALLDERKSILIRFGITHEQ